MKIDTVQIRNFRAINDCEIRFDDYTCMVGSNGVGKSTVLAALNIFFGNQDSSSTDVKRLDEEDFFKKDTSQPIEIKVTFRDLSDAASKDLGHYVRSGKLIVTSKATFQNGKAIVKQYGSRLGILDFAPFFEAGTASKKGEIYSALQENFDLPDVGSASQKAEALNAFEAAHPEKLVEIESETPFYGVTKGTDRIERHIQWVYVPAVKDAATEELEGKNTAVAKLLQRAVRSKVSFDEKIAALRENALSEYRELMASEDSALKNLSSSLEARLKSWGNPRAEIQLNWYHDPEKFKIEEPAARVYTGEQGFMGSISRLGHGLQRSYLISLLQELASLSDDGQATLILGIEEPELYQHPPQARHLSHVLQELSGKNSQIIAATHSPYFVQGRGIETVRLIRRNSEDQAYACSVSFDQLAKDESDCIGKVPVKPTGMRAILDPLMQPTISEMLFTDKLVLVEGLEDKAILSSWIAISGFEKRFREKGLSIVAVNGKSCLLRPAIIASRLEIPTLMVFDADGDCDEKYKDDNQKDNSQNIKWSGQNGVDDFPEKEYVSNNLIIWPYNIQTSVFSKVPETDFKNAKNKANTACGHVKSLDKNSVWLHEMLCTAVEDSWDMSLLNQVCEHICSDEW